MLNTDGTANNLGRRVDFLPGLQGSSAGPAKSTPYYQMPVARRVHAVHCQCVAVNYTGGVALATVKLTGAGNNALTVTLVPVTGVPNNPAIVAGGAGYAVNDTFSVTDVTGTGGIFTVTTVAGGVVTAATYNPNSATASPIDPGVLIGRVRQTVSSTIIRDISALDILRIQNHNRLYPTLGTLPLYYTEPETNLLGFNTAMAFDLFGQKDFGLTFEVNPGYLLPNISGTYEYDTQRNQIQSGGKVLPYLEIVSHKIKTINVAAGGSIEIPLDIDCPIRRVWLYGSNPGNITQVEVTQDGNKVIEGFTGDINDRLLNQYNFDMGQPDYKNSTQTAQKNLGLNPIRYFDTAAIFDPDQRYTSSLKVANTLAFKIWSAAAQQVTAVVERLPGFYKQ